MRFSAKLLVAILFFFAVAAALETTGEIDNAENMFLVKKHVAPKHFERSVACEACNTFCKTTSTNFVFCFSYHTCQCLSNTETTCPENVAWE